MPDVTCQRCGKLWPGDRLFVTCVECRKPPPSRPGAKKRKEGCTRYRAGRRADGRTDGVRENTWETKFGVDR